MSQKGINNCSWIIITFNFPDTNGLCLFVLFFLLSHYWEQPQYPSPIVDDGLKPRSSCNQWCIVLTWTNIHPAWCVSDINNPKTGSTCSVFTISIAANVCPSVWWEQINLLKLSTLGKPQYLFILKMHLKKVLSDFFFPYMHIIVHWHSHISTIWSQYEAGSTSTAFLSLMGAEVKARCSDQTESLGCGWVGRAWEHTAYNCAFKLIG